MSIQVTSTTDAKEVSAAQPVVAEKSAPESLVETHEQNDVVESETTQEDSDLEEHTEGHDEEETDESSDESGEEKEELRKDKPKKKGGFQRRIDKLNARYAEERQMRETLERRLAELERSAGGKSQDDSKAFEQQTQSPDGKPNPDAFDTHVEYVEALTEWKLEQREKAKEAQANKARLEAQQNEILKSHSERVKAFAKQAKDFQDVIEAVDDVPVSVAVQEIIVSSENGPALMYELAKNRDEFERINALPPLAAARELGRIESRIATHSSESKEQEPKKITKAPKPLEPVGGSGKGVIHKSLDDPNLSQAEYERIRRQQMKRAQG